MQTGSTLFQPGRRLHSHLSAWTLALLLTLGLSTGVFAQSPTTSAATPAVTEDAAENTPGVLIIEVQPDSPAAQAGLERGDILLTFNGEDVNDPYTLFQAIVAIDPEADDENEFEISWLHGSETHTATVELAEQDGIAFLGIRTYPDAGRGHMATGTITARPAVGMTGAATMGHPMLLRHAALADVEGVVIVEVVSDSPAAAAELSVGDIIVSFNGEPIADPAALQAAVQALAPQDSITLEVLPRSTFVTEMASEQEADAETDIVEPETQTVEIVLNASPDDEEMAFLGVRLLPAGSPIRMAMSAEPGEENHMFHFNMHPMHPMHPGMESMRGPRMMGRGMMGMFMFEREIPGEGGEAGESYGWRMQPRTGDDMESGRMFMWRDGGWGSQSRFGRFLIWGMNKLHDYGFDFQRMPMMQFFAVPATEAGAEEAAPQFSLPVAPRSSDFF